MSAITILIIRHAEKPEESWPGPGLTVNGVPDDKSLVIRGWQRAGSWSALFGTGLGSPDYPRPDLIYAADPNGTVSHETSQRPFETVTPLAARLGPNPPDTSCAVGEEVKLVDAVLGQTGVILIAWEHKAIARTILPLIAKDQSIPDMPTKWDGTRFDVVLRFDRASPDSPWTFRQLFPCLLSGDSDTPMP
jgi:hypothetical protein